MKSQKPAGYIHKKCLCLCPSWQNHIPIQQQIVISTWGTVANLKAEFRMRYTKKEKSPRIPPPNDPLVPSDLKNPQTDNNSRKVPIEPAVQLSNAARRTPVPAELAGPCRNHTISNSGCCSLLDEVSWDASSHSDRILYPTPRGSRCSASRTALKYPKRVLVTCRRSPTKKKGNFFNSTFVFWDRAEQDSTKNLGGWELYEIRNTRDMAYTVAVNNLFRLSLYEIMFMCRLLRWSFWNRMTLIHSFLDLTRKIINLDKYIFFYWLNNE